MAVGEAEIREFCLAHLRRTLEVRPEEIVADAKFARLGLDSASSVYLIVELEEWLGIELAPDIIAEHPTIAELAGFIAGQIARRGGRG